jgi:hypothetical protein
MNEGGCWDCGLGGGGGMGPPHHAPLENGNEGGDGAGGGGGGPLLNPNTRCAGLFQKVLGMSPKTFNDLAAKIPWFLSPNRHTLDPLTWNDIAFNGDNGLISNDLIGPEAITASPGGLIPAPVVLGPDWFLDTPARQNAVKLHEAVHSITPAHNDAWVFSHFKPYGLPDYEYKNFLGSTDEFTRWLLAGCPQKGVK